MKTVNDIISEDMTDCDYILEVGSERRTIKSDRHLFSRVIDEIFSTKPKIRASLYEHIYLTGMFDEWCEGFGLVRAVDKVRYLNK